MNQATALCSHCHTPLEQGSSRCPVCGTPVPEHNPAHDTNASTGEVYIHKRATERKASSFRRPPADVFKKRRKWPIILAIVLILAIAVGSISYFFVARDANAKLLQEYDSLVKTICVSTTPAQIAPYREALDVLKAKKPSFSTEELEELISACELYIDAPENEEKYTWTIAALSALKDSANEKIASCSSVLLGVVYEEYNLFLNGSTSPFSGTSPLHPGNISTMPLVVEGAAKLTVIDGEQGFSFTALNTSDKTIVYMEVLLFCYDEAGNDLIGADGHSWEWVNDEPTLAPGERHTPEKNNYWRFRNCSNVKIGVPFINYVRFSDGTYWGFTSTRMKQTDEFLGKLAVFKYSCDEQAKDYAAALPSTSITETFAAPPKKTPFLY